MSLRVLKWDVPVDGQVHRIGGGRVVLVACQSRDDVVQVWTEELGDSVVRRRPVRVFGTGQDVPLDLAHVGSTPVWFVSPFGIKADLIWHVYEGRVE